MILTCPACGTQYVVKDGAIPPGGRQVRCASCKHSWHQDLENSAETDAISADQPEPAAPQQDAADAESAGAAESEPANEPLPTAEEAYSETPPADVAAPEPDDAAPVEEAADSWQPPVAAEEEYEFSPFADREFEDRRRGPWLTLLLLALLIAVGAAAFWFLAPPSLKERLGLAGASTTQLQLMMTHSDRQTLESGNELLAVSGRVINPTDEQQKVPPIRAELRSASGKLVYSWTIAPPARVLPPGASATFNSAEVNVPAGGDELTISLGAPKA